MGIFGKIAALATVAAPAKAIHNKITGGAASAGAKTMAGGSGGNPPPPPPPPGGAGASKPVTKSMAGGGGFQPPPPPPPPKAGQNVFRAGQQAQAKKPAVENVWKRGKKS